MGAGANSSRDTALNDSKERAAGRIEDRGPETQAIRKGGDDDADGRGAAGGASGRDGVANTKSGNVPGEGGGGGGAAPTSDLADVKPSKRPARQRKA